MIMKRLYIMMMAVTMMLPVMAQKQSAAQKGQNLALKVLVEDMVEPFPATAKLQIETKLNSLLTQNGIASMDYLGQFFITAHVVPLTKDILPGPPTKISETMEITFYIADYYNQVIFSSATVNTKGVGETESKSYMSALKNLNLNSPVLKQFVAEGRAKVIDYYNTQADKMILKAKTLAKQRDFEQALWIVSTIPSECDKYETALAAGLEIYQEYIDYTCQVNLAAAKTAWMSGQNSLAAMDAGEYLSQIYPDASCYPEAEALYQEIKGKVLDDWKFEMRKYDDSVDLEFARIAAMRDVGVAYGTHQQPVSTNVGFLR